MTTTTLRKKMTPSLQKKIEVIAASQKKTFDDAVIFLLNKVVSPRHK